MPKPLCWRKFQATHELINANAEQLEIVKKQFYLGGASKADILTQQTQLAQTLASLPPLQKNLVQTRDALAALVGDLPNYGQIPLIKLCDLHLPTELPISIPSCLVRQRPDILAAEAQMHQFTAQIGVATANLLPQITLTGLNGREANIFKDLFNPHEAVWSLMAQVIQPIFQGGTLVARRRAAIAAYQQSCALYRQTVIQAFQNVADVLSAIEIDSYTLKAQAFAEKSAYDTLSLTKKQYKLGAASYLILLNAERQYQQAHINRIIAQAARYTDTAALFQALGGGWWNE